MDCSNMVYPKVLDKSIELLKKLPGVGEKSAERIALAINDFDYEDVKILADSLINCKNQLHPCICCGALTDEDECMVCKNPLRNKNVICVLENYKDFCAFEKGGTFDGVYHILNGLISPVDNIGPEDINISSLVDRVKKMDEVELILALRASIEGEATTLYIQKIFDGMNVIVSRLPYGIPMGMEIDYLDGVTLDRAIKDRKKLS